MKTDIQMSHFPVMWEWSDADVGLRGQVKVIYWREWLKGVEVESRGSKVLFSLLQDNLFLI